MDRDIAILVALCVVLGSISMLSLGYNAGVEDEHKKAVAAHAGHFVFDHSNGEKMFIYTNNIPLTK